MTGWHKVIPGEMRPHEYVLVFSEGVTPEERLASAIFGGEAQVSYEIVIARWRKGAWRRRSSGQIVHDVTHWMPMPEPP